RQSVQAGGGNYREIPDHAELRAAPSGRSDLGAAGQHARVPLPIARSTPKPFGASSHETLSAGGNRIRTRGPVSGGERARTNELSSHHNCGGRSELSPNLMRDERLQFLLQHPPGTPEFFYSHARA